MSQENNIEIRISVRNLVEFILRSGDIDNRSGSFGDKDAMQLGSKIHRKIQKQMDSTYSAEISLRHEVSFDEFSVIIEGRADGIIIEDTKVTIDEIKGVFMDLDYIKEPIMVHKAQAMCYAFIYAKQNDLKEINIQMTYCNMETEKIKRFTELFTFTYIEEWFTKLVEEYKKWALFQYEWKLIRGDSIKKIAFPFAYRSGQKDLIASVYRTIIRKKSLFVQAPTGVGKTLSTVFPAVKAVGEGLGDKIFYLTAKTITRTVAREAFEQLKSLGLSYKVITLTAKEKICACEEMDCNPVHCLYAKGHFDRINDAVYEVLKAYDSFTMETVYEAALEYMVCPYELSLDISTWVDAIICDYNYVFDPIVHLKRFFSEGVRGNYLFLIDEAHNLVERGREMFSAALYKEDFLELKKLVKEQNKKLASKLEMCNKNMLELKRECETYEVIPSIGSFTINLMNLMGEMEKFLEENEQGDVRKKVLEFYFEVRSFLDIHDRLDESYVIYTEHERDGRFKLKLLCVNTANNLQECLNKGNSTIFFSATLLPIQYYKSLLSSLDNNYAIYVESSFEMSQHLLLLCSDVSSKYTRRNYNEYLKMAQYIKHAVDAKKGNYMVFFPSYQMLGNVLECYQEICGSEEILCLAQRTNMNETQREEFLQAFQSKEEKSIVGFCVMGGIFGEGIDLKYDALIGALIIGTGLPQICNEREILKSYYDAKGENGFDYSYLYPGMNKVLQSAGRVIRTSEDRGTILLMDDRFLMGQYKSLFPREWAEYDICNLDNVSKKLEDFWS